MNKLLLSFLSLLLIPSLSAAAPGAEKKEIKTSEGIAPIFKFGKRNNLPISYLPFDARYVFMATRTVEPDGKEYDPNIQVTENGLFIGGGLGNSLSLHGNASVLVEGRNLGLISRGFDERNQGVMRLVGLDDKILNRVPVGGRLFLEDVRAVRQQIPLVNLTEQQFFRLCIGDLKLVKKFPHDDPKNPHTPLVGIFVDDHLLKDHQGHHVALDGSCVDFYGRKVAIAAVSLKYENQGQNPMPPVPLHEYGVSGSLYHAPLPVVQKMVALDSDNMASPPIQNDNLSLPWNLKLRSTELVRDLPDEWMITVSSNVAGAHDYSQSTRIIKNGNRQNPIFSMYETGGYVTQASSLALDGGTPEQSGQFRLHSIGFNDFKKIRVSVRGVPARANPNVPTHYVAYFKKKKLMVYCPDDTQKGHKTVWVNVFGAQDGKTLYTASRSCVAFVGKNISHGLNRNTLAGNTTVYAEGDLYYRDLP